MADTFTFFCSNCGTRGDLEAGTVEHTCPQCRIPWVIGACERCAVGWQVWRGAEKATCGACEHVNSVRALVGEAVPRPADPHLETSGEPNACTKCGQVPAYHRIGESWYCGACAEKRSKGRSGRSSAFIVGSVVALFVGGTLGIVLGMLASGGDDASNEIRQNKQVSLVPDVVGLSLREARSRIGEQGFLTITVIRKRAERSNERVIRQSPEGGLRATTDLPVTLTVEPAR